MNTWSNGWLEVSLRGRRPNVFRTDSTAVTIGEFRPSTFGQGLFCVQGVVWNYKGIESYDRLSFAKRPLFATYWIFLFFSVEFFFRRKKSWELYSYVFNKNLHRQLKYEKRNRINEFFESQGNFEGDEKNFRIPTTIFVPQKVQIVWEKQIVSSRPHRAIRGKSSTKTKWQNAFIMNYRRIRDVNQ